MRGERFFAFAEGYAAQRIQGFGDSVHALGHGFGIGFAGFNIVEDFQGGSAQAVAVFVVELAGEANRDPRLDHGMRRELAILR